jgi:outer membrane lipoprotein carrier protein
VIKPPSQRGINMKYFRKILLLILFISAPTVFAEPDSHQLKSLLSAYKSISADFTQKAYIKKKVSKTSSGTMALQRPGKFRWEITTPNHQSIIADGKNLWIYDVDLEQATKTSLTKDAHSPAILLSGSNDALEERFTLIDSDKAGDLETFRLRPKNNQDMVQQVEIKFDHQKLSEMSVTDNLGQKNVFYFTHVKINPSLSHQLFEFKAPKGVDVIQN